MLHQVVVNPSVQYLQRPLFVFTGMCVSRSAPASGRGCTDGLLAGTRFGELPSPEDGLYRAFRRILNVTFCVVGLPLPEDGRPLFVVLRVVFPRLGEDADWT